MTWVAENLSKHKLSKTKYRIHFIEKENIESAIYRNTSCRKYNLSKHKLSKGQIIETQVVESTIYRNTNYRKDKIAKHNLSKRQNIETTKYRI